MKKRSVYIKGHATSVTLEDEFWHELKHIAAREKTSINDLIAQIDEKGAENLSSTLRIFILGDLKSRLNQTKT